jgi:hypothetical protein
MKERTLSAPFDPAPEPFPLLDRSSPLPAAMYLSSAAFASSASTLFA